jgi:hypothetical protein
LSHKRSRGHLWWLLSSRTALFVMNMSILHAAVPTIFGPLLGMVALGIQLRMGSCQFFLYDPVSQAPEIPTLEAAWESRYSGSLVLPRAAYLRCASCNSLVRSHPGLTPGSAGQPAGADRVQPPKAVSSEPLPASSCSGRRHWPPGTRQAHLGSESHAGTTPARRQHDFHHCLSHHQPHHHDELTNFFFGEQVRRRLTTLATSTY